MGVPQLSQTIFRSVRKRCAFTWKKQPSCCCQRLKSATKKRAVIETKSKVVNNRITWTHQKIGRFPILPSLFLTLPCFWLFAFCTPRRKGNKTTQPSPVSDSFFRVAKQMQMQMETCCHYLYPRWSKMFCASVAPTRQGAWRFCMQEKFTFLYFGSKETFFWTTCFHLKHTEVLKRGRRTCNL